MKQDKATHRILVMIDGLNQHWMKRNWVDLQRLASLTPAVTEINVDRFNDEELDALLAQHDLDRSWMTM